MRKTLRAVAASATLAAALGLVSPGLADANTYNNAPSGSDYLTAATTLNYGAAHGKFKIRVWVSKTAGMLNWSISDRYSIKMYDNSRRLLWSAADQRDRTYDIGSNVTRIELVRNAKNGARTNWQRR